MFEKASLNKFDKNIFLVKNLQVSKETYSKSRDQSWTAKPWSGPHTLDKP